MSEVTKSIPTEGKAELTNTDAALIALCKYGRPRLSKQTGGWHASIEMFVTGEGVEFAVKTDFEQPSPSIAVTNLLSRVERTIKDLNK